MCISKSASIRTGRTQLKPEESLMAGELNSVQESIKLALDAADAATDVTSEYSQVKREHKRLEKKVSQIHRYTTITFVTGIIAAVVALTFSATLYFKSIAELKLMTTTNREGLIVFSENIEKLNVVLADLQESLSKQEELVKLNREATAQIAELNDVMASGTAKIVEELKSANAASIAANKESTEKLKLSLVSQSKSASNTVKVSLSSLESSLQKTLEAMDQRVASNETLNGVASRQQLTNKEIQAIKAQSAEIRKLLEVQQNRITFP
jgi:LysM repeat protein